MKLHLVFNAPVLLWEWFFELDDDLGLGPWDEHAPVHGQREPPEAPFAEDVRERLAEGAPAHEAFELRLLRAAEPPASIREDARARRSEDMSKQELGVHSRCLAPRIREPS